MQVADTSWLVAILDEDDAHHADALAQADAAGDVLIPGPVLAELLQFVFFRSRPRSGTAAARKRSREALVAFEGAPWAHTESSYDLAEASRVFHGNSKLSYVDAVGVAVARRSGLGLLTFDDEQRVALGHA